MLRFLRVENLAVVREVAVDFEAGLTVLTGETGAGKSILVDALTLLLGAKASSDMVRTGASEAAVEGIFRVANNAAANALLAEIGAAPEDGDLVVRREITASGRGRAFIGGRLQPLSVLRELGRTLADVHGQHEHVRLLEPSAHLDLLDHHAHLDELRAELADAHQRLRALGERLTELTDSAIERRRRADFLRFELREIEEVKVVAGEDEELERERRVLVHRVRVLELAEGAYQELYEAEAAVLGRLSSIERSLVELASYDEALMPLAPPVASARLTLEDVALTLRDYARDFPIEPDRLERIELRLESLQRLKAKYGPTLEAVLDFAERSRGELVTLEVSDDERVRLEREEGEARARYEELAALASARRAAAAAELEEQVERELAELAMEHARFRVRLALVEQEGSAVTVRGRQVRAGATGVDDVEFDFSANLGEEPRPLMRVASGGELSRLMLALRAAAGAHDRERIAVFHGLEAGLGAKVAVFDEIDAGIGGRVAHVLARKLMRLGHGRQVLCVTHLAAVAAAADHHLGVLKSELGGRTEVAIERLSGAGRAAEIARMLGGAEVTAAVRSHAAELLESMSAARASLDREPRLDL